MSGTTGGGVTVPTVPVPISMGGTGSTNGSFAAPFILVNATDPTKYVNEYVDTSGTLTFTNTSSSAMATINQGGALVTAGLAQVYGAANPVLIQGSADTGQVHLGLTTGLTGKNIGAVIGNVQGTGAIQAQVTTSTTVGGNARGTNATDWQSVRSNATQVAAAVTAVVSGGAYNTASAGASTVGGGSSNVASSANSCVPGGVLNVADADSAIATGRSATVHGLYGANIHASGFLATGGDAQSGTYVLRGRSTGGAAVRLTADGAAAGAANVCNLPNNTSWMGYLSIIARDTTLGGANFASWRNAGFSLVRGANAASAAVPDGSSTFTSLTNVAVSGNLAISADTANGGLNITFTPPNTNTWDVVAVFRTSEVQ